jgi:hypothetical protein
VSTAIPSTFYTLFLQFAPAFTQPSFLNVISVATGWILCAGRHTLSRVIRHGIRMQGRKRHHATLYRFLSRAVWLTDAVGQMMVQLLLPLLPDGPIWTIVDDTLCHRSGPHVWGAGMHHDPLRSTYGVGTKAGRQVSFSYGHNRVILSLWVPLPWNSQRGLAVPVLFRLYRSKKRCPPGEYRKRTELALDLMKLLASWTGPDRRLVLVSDSEYACRTLVQGLPPQADFIGPMPKDAAFFAPPSTERRIGRPRRKGARLPSPQELAETGSVPWRSVVLPIYGRQVHAQVKTQTGLWYRVAGPRLVRMILTRDPKGRIQDRAYVSTDPSFGVDQIAQGFSRRWTQEVTHRDVKQHLGLEDPQNGFWRRPHGQRPRRKRPGPQPHPRRGQGAVQCTAPMAFLAYGLVAAWYLQHGSVHRDVQRVKREAPWYLQEKEPSFADMLNAARRELWRARLSANPTLRTLSSKLELLLPEWLMAA